MKNLERVEHTFPAYYNQDSRLLILGSIPSKTSRDYGFYYMHPNNRFWKVLALVFQEEIKEDIPSKQAFLKKHQIALWDVIESCTMVGSSDSSIQEVVPTDLSSLINKTNIQQIFVLGNTAYRYYQKYSYDKIKIEAICLPSTSSANATWKLEELVESYQILNKK